MNALISRTLSIQNISPIGINTMPAWCEKQYNHIEAVIATQVGFLDSRFTSLDKNYAGATLQIGAGSTETI